MYRFYKWLWEKNLYKEEERKYRKWTFRSCFLSVKALSLSDEDYWILSNRNLYFLALWHYLTIYFFQLLSKFIFQPLKHIWVENVKSLASTRTTSQCRCCRLVHWYLCRRTRQLQIQYNLFKLLRDMKISVECIWKESYF